MKLNEMMTEQIAIDFEHPENNYYTVEQIGQMNREKREKQDRKARNWFYLAAVMMIAIAAI